jgi:hypothetical protein
MNISMPPSVVMPFASSFEIHKHSLSQISSGGLDLLFAAGKQKPRDELERK